jgi:amidase
MQGRRIQIDGPQGRIEAPYFQQIFWAGLVTVAYLPSTVFPTGVDKEGLPICLQVFGDAYDDFITIDFARLLAREIGGFVPPSGYDD